MKLNLKTYVAKGIPIFYELCRIAKIREIVNNMVEWREDNSKVSPGILVESLIISILSGKKPLWKLEEYWKKQDIDYFFRDSGIKPEQLNDDAYARVLDKLSEIKMEELVSKVSLGLLKSHGETISKLHLDTTSISLEGAYNEEVEEGEFNITYGHSKDHRPDLKQFKIGTAVQESGLPVMGELLSGNKSDREWNPESVKKMRKHFTSEGYKDVIYIGDSATVSSYESLKELSNLKFISRIPETFKMVNELKEKALCENNWEEYAIKNEESKHKVIGYIKEIEGVKYRFVVVNSRDLRLKKEKTISRKIERDKSILEKKIKKYTKKEFACAEDAKRFLEEFMKDKLISEFKIESKVEEKIILQYKKPGRPKAGEKSEEVKNYILKIDITGVNEELIKKLSEKEGCFVLITSILNKKEKTNIEILKEYKGQNSVELAFKFLKSPVYLGQIFLKKKKRIESLGYIFILVLLIASYFEFRVRKYMKENNEYLKQPNGSKTQRPTVKTLLELLDYIVVLVIDGERHLQENFDEKAKQVIKWAGFTPEIYLKYSVFNQEKFK